MAASNNITIKFKASGDKALKSAITALANEQDRLNKKFKGYVKGTKKAGKQTDILRTKGKRLAATNGILANSFATIRSKLLLVSFAMALGVKQLIGFAQQAAKVESMGRAFDTLSGGASNANIAMGKLKVATNNTMSEFDLFQQANNAMILGVSNNSDAMAEMFDMAQRLGSALGKDTKMSVESLITGIGRQSRLMLDNIGIIVKADKAYSDYATKIGKTSETLTDSERKQAFMNATLDAARDKLSRLPAEVLTSDQKLQIFSASIVDLQANIGDFLLPKLVSMAGVLSDIAEAFDSRRIKAYAKVIQGVLVVALIVYRKEINKTILAQTKLGWGALATAAGFLAAEILVASGAFDKVEKSTSDAAAANISYLKTLETMKKVALSEELMKQKAELSGLSPELVKVNAEIDKYQELLDKGIKREKIKKGNIRIIKDNEVALADAIKRKNIILNNSISVTKKDTEVINDNIKSIENQLSIIEKGFETYTSYTDSLSMAETMYQKTDEAQLANIESNISMVESLIKVATETDELIALLRMLEGQYNKTKTAGQKNAASLGKSFSQISSSGVAMAKGNKEQTITALQIGKAQGLANIYIGATQAIAAKGLVGVLEGIAVIAAGMSTIANIDSQIAAVKATKAEQGGLVGGRRHSSGGTMIEAERGEFIMSRNAVDSVGLEAMNRINSGGGGGAVSINFSGNVMSQDFIEDEAIPMIKEAIRRGADIGVA